MRFAIFSDVHANLEALEAVIADAREHHCTHFICLGDIVGYNANPRECVEIVRDLDCPTVKGNHDEQASQPAASGDFNEMAERAMTWTRPPVLLTNTPPSVSSAILTSNVPSSATNALVGPSRNKFTSSLEKNISLMPGASDSHVTEIGALPIAFTTPTRI